MHVHTIHTGEIWKRSFIATARPSVHVNPPRKKSFSKFKREEFEDVGFSFRVDGIESDGVTAIIIFSLQTNPKRPIIFAFLSSFSE